MFYYVLALTIIYHRVSEDTFVISINWKKTLELFPREDLVVQGTKATAFSICSYALTLQVL